MGASARDVVAFSRERVDLFDSSELKYERIHLLLIDEIGKGLDDLAAGRVKDSRQTLQQFKFWRRRNMQ